MAKISTGEKKITKKAATNYANAHWWGKYTAPEHVAQAFLAGVNYQRQIAENNGIKSSKPGAESNQV